MVTSVRIAVYNGNTRRNRFDLQVSPDGTAWTNVLTNVQTAGTSTQEETFDITDVSARFVRYVGHGNNSTSTATAGWNSLTEVSIFAVP